MKKASPTYYETVILKFLDPREVSSVYDIGVGPKSEYLTIKKRFPDFAFYGIEAYPPTYTSIKPHFPGPIVNAAISEFGNSTPVELVVHETNVMASSLIPYANAADGKKVTVPSMTLDEFDAYCNNQAGILLWMDIEGYELKALESGRKLMESGRVKLLNLEVRPRWNDKPSACTEPEVDELLEALGYKKCFVYNHYSSSRHHDAIYVHNRYPLPAAAKVYEQLYQITQEKLRSRDGLLDLALGVIDAWVACEERDDKIRYLRGAMSSKST